MMDDVESEEEEEEEEVIGKGVSINYVDKEGGGRGSPKCQRYFIYLFSKFVNEGGGGPKSSKLCQCSLWMPTY